MNGAHALLRTLVDSGVDACFMNPGTSEIHFVHALDAVPELRGVLTLFEGVATGAADGYARIAQRPASVLLHLGPGLGNGLANLHNAWRAGTPMVALVGTHATWHERYDAPLQSDIRPIAGTVSGWMRTTGHPRDLARDAASAVAAARGPAGRIATLVVPADVAWSEGVVSAPPREARTPEPVREAGLEAVTTTLRDDAERPLLLLGGAALGERGLRAAGRLRSATGATVLVERFPARMRGGADVPAFPRVAYPPAAAAQQLTGHDRIVLAGADWPVTFFAYPEHPGDLVPPDCEVDVLAEPDQDVVAALETLADRLAPGHRPVGAAWSARPMPTSGLLGVANFAGAVAAALPENAIVVDEANTAGSGLPQAFARGPAHDLLTVTGGAIGQGLPVATGAALAAPDRPVVLLEADGSAMYTIQALWTQAREGLDVTTVVINNGAYAVLQSELDGVGRPGRRAREMLALQRPGLDFTALAAGTGVQAVRVRTAEELTTALRRAVSEPGPQLIEAFIAPTPAAATSMPSPTSQRTTDGS